MARHGTVQHTAKRSLAIGILGVALLLSLAVGGAVRRAGSPGAVAAVPAGQDRVVQQDPDADAMRAGADANRAVYAVSPPNERDTDGTAGAPPATGGRAVYQLSPPNETDTGDAGAGGLAPARGLPYRVSPPNEQDPAGP